MSLVTGIVEAPPAHWVSVVVPCRNERAYIEFFCEAMLAQRLPIDARLEVLIADGCSDDGTRDWLVKFCADSTALDCHFVLVNNPGRIVSTGLNAAIAQARGDVIVRMDVHTHYENDYVAQCLEALAFSHADNVGGPWRAVGRNRVQCAVAAAFQSRLVAGGARSRQLDFDGWVDTVYLGCWPRATFQRFGGFDETLVRNQDDEHNLRLRLAGGRIWQSSRIRSSYRPRDTLKHLFRQQYQYGYWRPFVMRKHGQPGSVRQLVPAAFVAALAGTALLAFWWSAPLHALLSAYGAYLAVVSLTVALSQPSDLGVPRSVARRCSLVGRLGLVVPTYHLGYGLGSWRGLLDLAVGRRVSGDTAKITR